MAGFILRIDHRLDKPFTRIVVCKFLGLGSIIQSTPLLQTLRRNYPGARILFVTSQSNRTLLENTGLVDEVLTVDDSSAGSLLTGTLRLILALIRRKPEVYIDLEIHSNYSNLVSTLSLSTNRLGYFKKDKRFRKGIYTHLIKFNESAPISETYLEFAGLLGCKDRVTHLAPLLNDAQLRAANAGLQELLTPLNGLPYVVVNPNASDLRLERRWPLESYVELIDKLSLAGKVILIGNKVEKEYVAKIERALKNRQNVINTSGNLSFTQLTALIAGCRLMVTNDTGPMHIAFAMNRPTVALFGPCSPAQYGHGKNVSTLYKAVHCSPCVHRYIIPPCKGNNICMKNISVAEVELAVSGNIS